MPINSADNYNKSPCVHSSEIRGILTINFDIFVKQSEGIYRVKVYIGCIFVISVNNLF